MTLVAGVDSSTQSTKVVIRDAETGRLQRTGTAPHPDGTEVDPRAWWDALGTALSQAGGLADVECLSVAGQQHGLVCLDSAGEVIRPALLWNDTRSAQAASDLVAELGENDPAEGARRWAQAVGSVPVASFTVTKLRWLADHEPDSAARIAAIALPHDWLTWKLAGARSLERLCTDRSEASGTGYFDAVTNTYRRDLLALALRREETDVERIVLPRVLGADQAAARRASGTGRPSLLLGPGAGDNAAAALGLGLRPGETFVSLGTSGVVAALSQHSTADATGSVAGFADATGRFLPLAATLNGSRVLDAAGRLLDVDHEQLSTLALQAAGGADGLVLVPYLEGERTPNLPTATGSLHGITLASLTRENLARAAVEGVLCLLADALETVRRQGVAIDRVTLVGGGARSRAVREIAPAVLGVPVDVPCPGEYVADGAARQAAWVLTQAAQPPDWPTTDKTTHTCDQPTADVLGRYRASAQAVASSLTGAGWAESR